MKNIICIDLTKFNKDQLKRFCDINDFSYKPLLKLKLKTYAKLWIDSEGNCISFTLTEDNDFEIEDYDKMCFFIGYLDMLSGVKVYEFPKESVLDIDSILDNIIKYGKDSLTPEEIDFLDKYDC